MAKTGILSCSKIKNDLSCRSVGCLQVFNGKEAVFKRYKDNNAPLINCLCSQGRFANRPYILRGARNLNIFLYMPRFLRSVRLALYQAQTINRHFFKGLLTQFGHMCRILPIILLLTLCSVSVAEELDLGIVKGLIDNGRFVRLREIAEQELRDNNNSVAGNYMMGVAMYRGETNLPLAYHYLERARSLVEQEVFVDNSTFLHINILLELERIVREIDKNEEHLGIIDEIAYWFGVDYQVSTGWTLMKMGRYDEARDLMRRYANSKDPEDRLRAMNTLGALEHKLENYDESFNWFTVLKKELAARGALSATALRNRAEVSMSLLLFREAESDLLLATRHFDPDSYSNPWQPLVLLYAGEGRLSEGLSAVREMHQWNRRSSPVIEQQHWNECRQTVAVLLMALGYDDKALEIIREIRNRPDRRGATTGSIEQSEIELLHLYREALLLRRERLREEAGWAKIGNWLTTIKERLKIQRELWMADRRLNALLMPRDRLSWILRPYATDSISAEWLRPGLRGALKNGPMQAGLTMLLARQGGPSDRERPYLQAALGETLTAKVKYAAALPYLIAARTDLPMEEVLLRARVEALIARVYERQGDDESAVVAYRNAMERDPGVFRSLGISLPVVFSYDGSDEARDAVRFLEKSPRFHKGYGFRLSVEMVGGRLTARLSGRDGATLTQAYVAADESSGPKLAARMLCQEIHRRAFAPKIDLSQADINSLDGSTTSGYTVDMFGVDM